MLTQRKLRKVFTAVVLCYFAVQVDALVEDAANTLDGGVAPQVSAQNQVAAAEQSALRHARDLVRKKIRGQKTKTEVAFTHLAKNAISQAKKNLKQRQQRRVAANEQSARERHLKKREAKHSRIVAAQAVKFEAQQTANNKAHTKKKAGADAHADMRVEATPHSQHSATDQLGDAAAKTSPADIPEPSANKKMEKAAASAKVKASKKAAIPKDTQSKKAVTKTSPATTPAEETPPTKKSSASRKTRDAGTPTVHKVASLPSTKTRKEWKKLALEASIVAKDKLFFSKMLNKVSKTEDAYSGLLMQETATESSAEKTKVMTDNLLKQFHRLNVGNGVEKTHLMSNTDLGESVSEAVEVQQPTVVRLERRLAESKANAKRAKAAEAEAQKMVKQERHQLAEVSKTGPAPPSKTTKELKQQRKQYKKATVSLKKQKGTVAAVAAQAAAAAEEEAKKQVSKAKARDDAKQQHRSYQKQADEGQVVSAAERQEHQAISSAQDADDIVKKAQKELTSAEQQVARLKAGTAAQTANAVPIELHALDKEMASRKELASRLQVLSDTAQTEEARQERLDAKAHRIRGMAVDVKNAAEQRLDQLGRKVGNLGESLSDQSSQHDKWGSGIKKDETLLQKDQRQVKSLVKEAQHISLDAAKIQEEQFQAADASSRLEVDAHVMAKKLAVSQAGVGALKNSKPGEKEIHSKLKELGHEDHKLYLDLTHLSGEAMNADSAEEAGVAKTKAAIQLGNSLLHDTADSLMPNV